MKKIAIFASGAGTNAENIIRFYADNENVGVALVLSNRADAGVHDRAAEYGIPSFTFTGKEFGEGSAILKKLSEYSVDLIVLAGFMLKIPPSIIAAYPQKTVNIHPALLPKFGGKGMYGRRVHEAVVAAGETKTGITVHFVNENYDEGQILLQVTISIFPEDTAETVEKKVHSLEYKFFPLMIDAILEDPAFSSK